MAIAGWRTWIWRAATVGLLAGSMGWQAPALAVTIELNDVAADRIERQLLAARGELPLPGTPDPTQLAQRLAEKGLATGSEVFIRIFKAESELELWLRKDDRFELLDTYPICHWSGTLGPKIAEGDKQNPEGFYKIGRRQLHLAGRWPRSLNLGFPNPYDRALARTGSYILVHGGCSSTGCFAMTNPVMKEIYGLTEGALRGGQPYVNVHVFPFRMTAANMERFSASEWKDFWRTLKEGYDAFELSRVPPRVGVCDRHYVVQQVEPGVGEPPSNPRSRRRVRFVGIGDFSCASVRSGATETGAGRERAEDTPSRESIVSRPSQRTGEDAGARPRRQAVGGSAEPIQFADRFFNRR